MYLAFRKGSDFENAPIHEWMSVFAYIMVLKIFELLQGGCRKVFGNGLHPRTTSLGLPSKKQAKDSRSFSMTTIQRIPSAIPQLLFPGEGVRVGMVSLEAEPTRKSKRRTAAI